MLNVSPINAVFDPAYFLRMSDTFFPQYNLRHFELAPEGKKMRKLRADCFKVSRTLNLRKYMYTAYIRKSDLKVARIVAGCRTWYSFEGALAHYHDAHKPISMMAGVSSHAHYWENGNHIIRFDVLRMEAKGLLDRLRKDCNNKIAREKRKRRAKR